MKILALESADGACSLALLNGDECRQIVHDHSRDSLAWLLPGAARLLAEAGLGWTQLDGIACCIGPGGFTGVRVSVGLAQGWGLAADRPVAGISSLAALAFEAADQGHHGPLRVALDARMGELYAGHFSVGDTPLPRALAPERLLRPAELLPELTQERLAGPGFEAYAELFDTATLLGGIRLQAAAVAKLAAGSAPQSWRPAGELAPRYLRHAVAQTMAERRAAKGDDAA